MQAQKLTTGKLFYGYWFDEYN